MSFYLFGNPDESLRLKNVSSSTRNGKGVIKIEIETDSLDHLSWAVRDLEEVRRGQRAKPEPPKPHPQPKSKPLALPAPQLALPKPEEM
ncbi:hypothetical protein [Paracoccus denitrificans]|uniref:hypothetical protein n=1 Tax=Paracoccus denitrificans TaxID=266 RepID=UPI003364D0E6